MSISSISGSNGIYQTAQSGNDNSIRQNFQKLGNALSSGNLSDAQSAFATILQNFQGKDSNSGNGNSQLNNDFQSLQSALKSGDLTSAQNAYAALQKDMQSVHGHHHHHKGNGDQTGASSSTNASSNTLQSAFQALIAGIGNMQSSNNASGTITNNSQVSQVLQALQSNLSSGNTGSAQNSSSDLIQSLQNLFGENATGNIIDVIS